MTLAAMAATGALDGLGHEGHGTAGAGVHLQHIDAGRVRVRLLDSELHVHQAAHVQRPRHGLGLALEFSDGVGA